MRKKAVFATAGLILLLAASQIVNVGADPATIAGTPTPCEAPDNGTGTVTLPAPCPYVTLDGNPMMIIDGLPPSTAIELDATLMNFTCNHDASWCLMPLPPGICEMSGGSLGGHGHCFEATLDLIVTGIGDLNGFNRHLAVPVVVEIHTGPRNPGDPVQTFDADIYRLQGELFGDPDFCTFRIIAGTDYGLPSPGRTTLTDLGGGLYDIDSFFDITYQIEFQGCPGSVLEGYSGTTTRTTRIWQGEPPEPWQPGDGHKMHFPQLPDEEGWDVNATYPLVLGEDWTCSRTGWVKDLHFWGSWLNGQKGIIDNFLISISEDIPADGELPYSRPGDILWERTITNYREYSITPGTLEGWFDPSLPVQLPENHQEYFQYDVDLDSLDWFWQEEGRIYWLCISADITEIQGTRWGWKSSLDHWEDYATWTAFGNPCIAPDNGTGTVTLPADCPFVGQEPMMIIDGFPPGTTVEMDAILMDFICRHDGGWCSMPLAPGECEMPGGSLGGHGHCFEATLDLTVRGTGSLAGFSRHLAVPVVLEVHTGPRNPGDPVQLFAAEVYRLQGQLWGDPDFCEFIVIGGSDNGLPSPGQITLTDLGDGTFQVDSFFDITYQIQFEGCPGSVLEGYSGTTTATARFVQGESPLGIWQELAVVDATCIAPDNGTGTVTLPADCPFTSPEEVFEIIDGLPPGTTIELDPIMDDFYCNHGSGMCSLPLTQDVCEGPGGSLGGDGHCFEATLYLDVSGTGELAGFSRHLAVPVELEVHTGPRTPGNPVQTFPAEVYRFTGQLYGDPDFCEFIITGGSDFGLPGPGQMTLTELPSGDFAVESFFDVTYQISFEGCPGSVLETYAGTTTATIRLEQGGEPVIEKLNLAFVITDGCVCGLKGDVNHDGSTDPLDVSYLVNKVFLSQDALHDYTGTCTYPNGDVNCDSSTDPLDVSFLVNKVFLSQDALCDRCSD